MVPKDGEMDSDVACAGPDRFYISVPQAGAIKENPPCARITLHLAQQIPLQEPSPSRNESHARMK